MLHDGIKAMNNTTEVISNYKSESRKFNRSTRRIKQIKSIKLVAILCTLIHQNSLFEGIRYMQPNEFRVVFGAGYKMDSIAII
ncbi:hypothetical protein SAMN05421880_12345 [Nitrosomonas nitrosa]|uniref:Uncharacterized protein n=1 Tax=Nitrosomonas nitrosa TaxID=52442 RepID=A0A1I4SAJ7_9PROT|nr:hypothetical protein SAMN05421880_12345 [Nitrosomonas nitrosa]